MVSEANFRWVRALVAPMLCWTLAACQAPPVQVSCTSRKDVSVTPTDGLRVKFFGTSTLVIDDGNTALMIDGFFSRPGKLRLVFGAIAPHKRRIDDALEEGKVPKLAAVFVAHSHHDHAMDSAVVAECTGAKLVGSLSTRNIRGHALQAKDVETLPIGGEREYGDFKVQAFESWHTPGFLTTLLKGDIEVPFEPPAHALFYREGGNYSFLLRHPRGTILIHPSAGAHEGLYRGVCADVVFLGIGLLGNQDEAFARRYWNEAVRATGARIVIPIHWDDITVSLRKPLRPAPWPFDDYEEGVRMVTKRGTKDGILVEPMQAFETRVLRVLETPDARTTGEPPCPFEPPPATPSAPR